MRKTYVPPSGDPEARLAIVGEQPGKSEIFSRPPKPFKGSAGQGLDECLSMTKIIRSELYLTNVIKDLDHPLSYYINIDKFGRSTISEEGFIYIKELGAELAELPNLNCIVACGNVPLLALANRSGITKWRGSVIECNLVPGVKVVPTFHPSSFVKPKFQYFNKPLIIEDLLRAKFERDFPELHRTTRNIATSPTFDEAVDTLNYAYDVGRRGQTIALDIEVINGEVDCISVGWDMQEAMSIPFNCQNGDYLLPEQELHIMRLVGKIIEDERISKGGANFIFDLQFLFRKYGLRPRGQIQCTQIAQKIAFPDYKAGLDFVTTMHTDIPYYKADGKEWMKLGAGTWEEWWLYNGMDSIVPLEALPKQMEILRQQGNFETYSEQKKLIEPLIYMGERGIKVDIQGMSDYKVEQEKELTILANELNEEVGYDINYNSPQQMMKYFYTECGIKPYKKRNAQGKYVPTADVDALKRIVRRDIKGSIAARIMLDIRSLSKRISTYLNIGKVDKDARYRSSYKPVGAETGRLSSGKTIFGTGGNQQNWPHDLLRFFVFDEGYIGYSIDLSQIENRIVAYVGGVVAQIKAFEAGRDLHRLTATSIFGKGYDEISAVDGSSSLGDGRQSERYWGKKGNHATNYDVGIKTFALKNEMQEAESKATLERIHMMYPQIRGGYHKVIQNMLLDNRTITNLFGRNRLFLGPIIQSFPNVPKYAVLDTFRQAYAHFAQSTCADKINRQGVNYIYYNQDQFEHLEMLTQVHDSIVFQIPTSVPSIEHARMILDIKNSLEQPLFWHEREIVTPADLSIGFNMCSDEMKELKSKNIPTDVDTLAEMIREIHRELLTDGQGETNGRRSTFT